MSAQIHWHEGLFLQPHHLQSMQRSVLEAVVRQRKRTSAHPYGLVESRLSLDALENMQVRFESLHAVMRSGEEIRFPGNAELPALDIKDRFEATSKPLSVCLALPLWYDARANTVPAEEGADWRTKRIFRVAERTQADENTGENPQPVPYRHLNARLIFADEDQTDLEVLPLLRIIRAAGAEVGLPQADPSFIPPCFAVSGSPRLFDLARDLANAVEASRRELATQMTRAGFSVDTMRGTQFQQMLRLKSLSRFATRLPILMGDRSLTPFDLFLELCDLHAELVALHPDRDLIAVPAYSHDEPAVCFLDLDQKLRGMLRPLKGDVFRKVVFAMDGPVLAAALGDEDLSIPNEYFLGIKSKEDPRAIAALVEDEDKFKLMAKSMWQNRIRGVKLVEERHPPVQFPAESDLRYFRLMRTESQRMWDRIGQEKEMAVWWPEIESSDFRITLYMSVPEGSA